MKKFLIYLIATLNFLLTFVLLTLSFDLMKLEIEGALVGGIILVIIVFLVQYFIIVPTLVSFTKKYLL